jgi:Leucine-rich repeat (LRR) protein
MLLSWWMFLIVPVVFLTATNETAFPSSQFYTLYDLYEATNGQNWYWKSNGKIWNFTDSNVNPCIDQWQGLVCLSSNTSISKIRLGEYNLVGTIPTSVASFVNLTTFNLTTNNLIGAIPSSLFDLQQLSSILLQNNSLVEFENNSFPLLLSLTYLDLSDNLFTGPFMSFHNFLKKQV